jgi:TatD DNase family protein
MTSPLIDIGVNLTHRSYDKDRDQVIARARDAGVAHVVVTGTNLGVSSRAVELADRHPGALSATVGVHPHDAKHWTDESARQLEALASRAPVVAIGECGLDFNRDFSPREDQARCFEAQLQLAVTTGLPVFLHERDAHERFLDILSGYRARLCDAVVHCFTGTEPELRRYIELDLHIGVTGWVCDERRGQRLRELVREIPRDRLMIETDAPFLTPRDLKPKPPRRNEPRFLPHVLQTIARCRGEDVDELARATTATASRFFGLVVHEP